MTMMILVFNPFKYIAKILEFRTVINNKGLRTTTLGELYVNIVWGTWMVGSWFFQHHPVGSKRDFSTGPPKYPLSVGKWWTSLRAVTTTVVARPTCHSPIDFFSKETTSPDVFRQFMHELNVCISFPRPQVSSAVQMWARVKTAHTGVCATDEDPWA